MNICLEWDITNVLPFHVVWIEQGIRLLDTIYFEPIVPCVQGLVVELQQLFYI